MIGKPIAYFEVSCSGSPFRVMTSGDVLRFDVDRTCTPRVDPRAQCGCGARRFVVGRDGFLRCEYCQCSPRNE